MDKKGARPDEISADIAAKNGYVDVLKWLWEKYKIIPSQSGVNYAARNGKIDVLNWLEPLGEIFIERSNKISALVDLYSRCVLSKTQSYDFKPAYAFLPDIEEANAAIENNNLEILKWLEERNILPDNVNIELVIMNSNISILNWLEDKGLFKELPEKIISFRKLSPDVINWLERRNILFCQK